MLLRVLNSYADVRIEDIDQDAFAGDLPSAVDTHVHSESWTDNLNNLKHIYELLTDYIIVRCRRKLPLPSGEPDLEAIARSASENDVSQLLKLVLLAAVFGRFSMDYIQQLTTLSEEAQAQFFLVLQEPEEVPLIQPDTYKSKEDGTPTEASEDVQEKDAELIYEERIAELVAVNKSLEHDRDDYKEQLESMHDLHTNLQKNYDLLETQAQDTAERLDALRSGKGEQSMLGIQRTKMQQQETVIATLESQLSSLQDENRDLKIKSDILQGQAEGFQQMQDDLYELKLEREQLQRKANAADKYKQKLQSLQKVEEENEALKHRVTGMQRQLKESDSDQLINADLRRENEEIRSLVSNIEQELSESIEAKKRAEFEKMTLQAKLKQADDQAARWHARAEELQASQVEYSSPGSPLTPRAPSSSAFVLDASEDDDLSQQDPNPGKETSRIQADDQNMISEEELQAIISIMKAHTQNASKMEKTSSFREQQKLAEKIEKSRATVKELTQVIDFLAQPRVEFVGAKNIDETSPYKPVPPHTDDLASTYGVASQSARSSITSLSAVSRRSSVASFHSFHSATTPRKRSILRGFFGSAEK